jgi:hypothetical protein
LLIDNVDLNLNFEFRRNDWSCDRICCGAIIFGSLELQQNYLEAVQSRRENNNNKAYHIDSQRLENIWVNASSGEVGPAIADCI